MKKQDYRSFLTIWLGQTISLFGTNMTRFALLIWAYELTGQATSMALLGVFSFGSLVLFSPLAGYIVDKFDRRLVMLWADLVAGIVLLLTLLLVLFGQIELWHLYFGQALIGGLEAFQSTAYTAISSVLIPREQYGRINGLRYLGTSIAEIGAPLLGAAILLMMNIEGVFLFNVITFLLSVLLLAIVDVENLPQSEKEKDMSFMQQMKIAWDYLSNHRGLMALLILGTFIELNAALTYMSIFPAMILARTGGDELTLSIIQSAIGVGAVLGSILMSIWGGPRRKVHGALGLTALSFIVGDLLFGLGQDSMTWIIAGVATAIFFPFMVGGDLAIWQAKVPAHIQGRVLNLQGMIRYLALPIGYILGGLLADYVFEPAMMDGGALVGLFGGLVGTGAGAGMAVMFLITGTLGGLAGILGYLYAPLRNVEEDEVDNPHLVPQGA